MLILNRREGKSGTPLSEFAEGTLIKIAENGTLVEFYVSKHDYESSLNGAGRTLVVRKDVYDQREWNNSNVNTWARCTMRHWLDSTYKALLDSDIQELMGRTTYDYTPGNGDTGVGPRSDAVFLLSLTELGQSHTYANTEGSALPIANTLKVAYLNGNATTQWTRSPYMDTTWGPGSSDACGLDSSGGIYGYPCTRTFGSRPAFTLPSTTPIDPDTMEVIA